MPCNSDYLEANIREKGLQRAANLAVYVTEQLGKKVPPWLAKAADDVYCSDERTIPALCKLLTNMSNKDKEAIVYNSKSKISRQLADWWEEHQLADKERLDEEAEISKIQRLRKSALAKLTKAEIDALNRF